MSMHALLAAACIVGGFCCFFPFLLGQLNDFNATVLSAALSSRRSRDLAVASITLIVPLYMGILTDTITSLSIRDKSKKIRLHVGQELLNTQERFALACAILVVAMPSAMQSNMPNLANVWMCLRNFRLMLVGGIVNVSLCRYDRNFWSMSKTCTSLALLAGSTILDSCAINLQSLGDYPVARIVASVALLVAVVIFLSCCFRWLRSVCPKVYRGAILILSPKTPSPAKIDRSPKCYKHLLFPLLYVTSITMITITLVPLMIFYPPSSYNDDALFFDSLGNIIFLLFIMYISDRMMKYEVIEGLVSHNTPCCYATRFLSINLSFLATKLAKMPPSSLTTSPLQKMPLSAHILTSNRIYNTLILHSSFLLSTLSSTTSSSQRKPTFATFLTNYGHLSTRHA